jgi:hypothetical protein
MLSVLANTLQAYDLLFCGQSVCFSHLSNLLMKIIDEEHPEEYIALLSAAVRESKKIKE